MSLAADGGVEIEWEKVLARACWQGGLRGREGRARAAEEGKGGERGKGTWGMEGEGLEGGTNVCLALDENEDLVRSVLGEHRIQALSHTLQTRCHLAILLPRCAICALSVRTLHQRSKLTTISVPAVAAVCRHTAPVRTPTQHRCVFPCDKPPSLRLDSDNPPPTPFPLPPCALAALTWSIPTQWPAKCH